MCGCQVYALVTGPERETWGRVCKSVAPMQPDELHDRHFRVARKILHILMTNDRCIEFIPDLAYPFLLDPVSQADSSRQTPPTHRPWAPKASQPASPCLHRAPRLTTKSSTSFLPAAAASIGAVGL